MRPDLDRMAGPRLVTLLAREMEAAGFQLYGDHVKSGSIVGAASLRIQIDSAKFRARVLHRSTDYRIMKESY
jgi:hypothetical protein